MQACFATRTFLTVDSGIVPIKKLAGQKYNKIAAHADIECPNNHEHKRK
jgi:hypothetical protein